MYAEKKQKYLDDRKTFIISNKKHVNISKLNLVVYFQLYYEVLKDVLGINISKTKHENFDFLTFFHFQKKLQINDKI